MRGVNLLSDDKTPKRTAEDSEVMQHSVMKFVAHCYSEPTVHHVALNTRISLC